MRGRASDGACCVLVAAIRSVAAGDAVVDPSVTRRLVDRWVELEDDAAAVTTPVDLTAREREILLGLARGLTNRALGAELHLSEATIKSHVSSLLLKLGLQSRVQAVIHAYEVGVVRPRDGRDLGGA